MREVYRGNGFVIRTHDCGEIFVSREDFPDENIRLSTLGAKSFNLSYGSTNLTMIPTDYKQLRFSS